SQPGPFPVALALPMLTANYLQVEIELQFGLEHLSQLASGHAMPHGQVMEADKRFESRIEHRARYVATIDRIGAIEYDESLALLSRCAHGLPHGGDVGIKSAADVLDVEHEGIEIGQHLR